MYTAWYGLLVVVLGSIYIYSLVTGRDTSGTEAQKAAAGKDWVDEDEADDSDHSQARQPNSEAKREPTNETKGTGGKDSYESGVLDL